MTNPAEPSAPDGDKPAAPADAKPAASAASPIDNYLDIKAEPERATLLVKSSLVKDGIPLTRDDLAKKLQSLKVVEGIDWATIDKIIAGKLYDRTHIIASGIVAKPSKDGRIEEKIKVNPDIQPVVGKDGKADYRNVDNIHQVKKGDVLAVRHPPVQGEPGKDIFGKITPAKPVKDATFKVGANTSVTTDGLNLVADTGGYVFLQAGAICVGVEFVLNGDVNFKTGNLHYNGNISVTGGVADGFVVEADGNITIEGNVEGAEITSREGNVWIKSALFGHGKAKVMAKGNIRVLAAQDAELECQGILEVDKGLRNCKVTAETLKADSAGCYVVGGKLKCYADAFISVVGSEGCRTEIHIVDKKAEESRKRLAEIDKMKAGLAAKLELVEKKLKGMKAMAAKMAGGMSERSLAQLKETLAGYTELKKALETLDAEKEKLGGSLNSAARHTGKLGLKEKVVWGGYLELYGHIRELSTEDAGKEWSWGANGLTCRSYTPSAPEATPPPAA